MKVLFIGDIVGAPGREIVQELLPSIKEEHKIDLVIANGENAAHGKGITKKIYNQLLSYGIDVITLGNHAFSKEDVYSFIDYTDSMIRPANLLPKGYGKTTCVKEVCGKKVAVMNMCGEVFMYDVEGNPFLMMDDLIDNTDADIFLLDFHAEATSEKIAMAYYLKNRASAVVGTHTHVQTADERIIGKCATISDLGMCGAYDSVLGRDVDEILTRFTSDERTRYTIAKGRGYLCGVVVEIEDETGQALSIERIQIVKKALD